MASSLTNIITVFCSGAAVVAGRDALCAAGSSAKKLIRSIRADAGDLTSPVDCRVEFHRSIHTLIAFAGYCVSACSVQREVNRIGAAFCGRRRVSPHQRRSGRGRPVPAATHALCTAAGALCDIRELPVDFTSHRTEGHRHRAAARPCPGARARCPPSACLLFAPLALRCLRR